MASSSIPLSVSPFPTTFQPGNLKHSQLTLCHCMNAISTQKKVSYIIQAAKLPAVELPKVEPKFAPPFLGFSAEVWNSRACVIGLIGTFIVEWILNKGILQVIGVDVGKGLNLPL